jgi:hypothetical protein
MDPRQQSAKQLSDTLVAILTPCRHRASECEWDAIEEAIRRLTEHERLVQHVLPELRDRLTEADPGEGRPDSRLAETRTGCLPCEALRVPAAVIFPGISPLSRQAILARVQGMAYVH